MSQLNMIERVLMRSKSGVTSAQLASKAHVPKGNIHPHIAVLRHKYNIPIVSTRQDTKNGAKTVFAIPEKFRSKHTSMTG